MMRLVFERLMPEKTIMNNLVNHNVIIKIILKSPLHFNKLRAYLTNDILPFVNT